jgi:adenylosuccinate synthase
MERCQPEYIEMPGWSESTVGARRLSQLPDAARAYLDRIEDLCDTPIAIISTGPDRAETIIQQNPFGD